MTEKKHGNIGNKNASKGGPAKRKPLHIYTSLTRKNLTDRAAGDKKTGHYVLDLIRADIEKNHPELLESWDLDDWLIK